jgi:predicted RND superfamily exporter protein
VRVYDAAFLASPLQMSGVVHRAEGPYDAALFDVTTQAGEAGANAMRTDAIAAFDPVAGSGVNVVVTSDEIINDVIVTTLRDSQLSSLLLTLIAALILLVINFWFEARRPMLGVITTLPVALVVLLSFAIMAILGIPFGPVTATIAALAIGIGIPYMIHITHRYLEDRERHEGAAGAIESTLTHTGGALAGSALTTVAGFGILVTSTTIPFRQFGFVTAYTILLAMLGAILVLPSMLVLWDRWHRNRGEEPFDTATVHAALQKD